MLHSRSPCRRLLLFASVLLASSAALGLPYTYPESIRAACTSAIESSSSASDGDASSFVPSNSSGLPDGSSTNKAAFEEIEVRGERGKAQNVVVQPQAVGIVTQQDIRRTDGLFLDESINLLPGVRLENRTVSGGQRITIRGYGNGTNFNGTGYKAYLNGIPITDAEGNTILDDIDISTLGSVEVIRGPASSLYGSGIAGVVKMYTLRPQPRATRFTEELLGGTQALFRTNTRVEHGADNSSILLNYGRQQSDGYRIHTKSRKDYVLLTADLDPSPRQSFSFYGAYNRSFEQLAGQLTDDQFTNKQNYAEPPYLANDAHVALDSVRMGVSHSYEFHPAVSNVTTVFATGYQVDQPFAGARTDNLSLNYGARTEFNLRFEATGFKLTGVLGSEIQQNTAFKKSYNNPTVGEVVVLGAIRSDLQVVALQSNSFTQWDLSLPYEFILTAGASLNVVHYSIKDRITALALPGHADQSGARDFDPEITPRIALSKAFNRTVAIYAQVSQGYSAPTSGAVVIPLEGVVNKDLKPERGTVYEVGTKGNLLERRLSYELALFDMVIQDKFTPITRSIGGTPYSVTTNGGDQKDLGLELASKYSAINDRNSFVSLVQPFVSYTLSSFHYDNFKNNNNNDASTIDYSNKKVVGVPTHVLNIGLDSALQWGVYLNATYQYVDSVPLTYDNAHTAKSYSLLSAKLGYRRDLAQHFRLDVFAGGNNLLGDLYYTMVFLNQNYSGPAPQVYLPGPYKATFYGGVNLSYAL